MSLAKDFGGWQNNVRRTWSDDVKELKRAAATPKTTYNTLSNYAFDLLAATIVQPADVRRELAGLAPAFDQVIARAATDSANGTIPPARLKVMDFVNALECAGCSFAAATADVFRDWLGRMQLVRDDRDQFHLWSAGFAALALDERPTYRRLAARAGESNLPFTPAETFGFNVQALLGYLAAAVENHESLPAVTPAWQELLRNYHLLYEVSSVRDGTLLWIARIVHHRIAGAPLGEVSQRLQDDILRLSAVP